MSDTKGLLRVSLDLDLDPRMAFDALLEELTAALAERGIRFEPGADGRVTRDALVLGRVQAWEPGRRIALEWRPTSWDPEPVILLEIRVERADDGSRLTIEQRGWEPVIGEGAELVGWFAHRIAAPLLETTAPVAIGDWLTDRMARRSSGPWSRGVYRDPLFHHPNFRVILAELALTPADYLLEVGCGGGALLKLALESGCRAAAIDHSPEMVRLAREENRDAIAAGRLDIVESSAHSLPFQDGRFTCAAMTGVLGFLSDPVAALREMHRALRHGGRAIIMGADPENRGTPAAPEPMASRLTFYDEHELGELGRAGGFESVRVVRREMGTYAREVGVPEEALPLFEGPGSTFLLATKT